MSAASGGVTALHRRAGFRQPPGEPVALRPPHVHMWRPRWKAGHFRIPPKDRPCPALHIRHSMLYLSVLVVSGLCLVYFL